MTIDKIRSVVHQTRFMYTDEDELQEALAITLRARGLDVAREVRLNERDRIDLLVSDGGDHQVGIEVKIAGRPASVLRQLERYAECPEIDELVLITSKVRHAAPAELNGKPTTVICLVGKVL